MDTTHFENNTDKDHRQEEQSPSRCPFAASAAQHDPSAKCPFSGASGSTGSKDGPNKDGRSEPDLEPVEELPPSHPSGKTCPWPFLLLHDPKAGMQKWQTWSMIGLVLVYTYQRYVTLLES